ncbi:cobalamin biosynthesis family protein [Enterovibrio sp. Hal110]
MTELPTPFETLLGYSTLLAMWGALLLHWFFPVPPSSNPLSLWRRVADAIADKVNHPDDEPQQRKLAGALAFGIMWLTLAVALIALKQLVWIPWLFDLLLLWLVLGWRPIVNQTQQLEQALAREDKPAARTLLAETLNRDTQSLSGVGIAKASCETLLLGYARQVVGVLFWYALLGGIGAFLYTLVVLLARTWPTRREEFAEFGLFSAAFLSVLDWVPTRLFALLIAAGHRFEPAMLAIRDNEKRWVTSGSDWVLSATGAKFQLSLGGPAIYDNQKITRPKLGGDIAPSSVHLALLNQQLRQKAWLWIVLQSFTMWFAHGFL